MEKRAEGIDNSFPDLDTIQFHDLESSWSIFLLLEATSSEFGWNMINTLGRSWIDIPDELQEDLLTWRWLQGIAENIRKRQNA